MTLLATQHAFYTIRVPEQFNQTLETQRQLAQNGAAPHEHARLEEMEAVRAAIAVTVRAKDQNYEHLYAIEGGEMRLVEKAERTPFMRIRHSLEDFPNLHRECGDSLLGFLGGLAGLGDEMRLTALRVRSLRELAGRLLFERVGSGGFSLHASFGTAVVEAAQGPSGKEPEPRATIRIDDTVYALLRSGELDPQDAFLDGRIEIEGDLEMAIGLALAAASPD